MTDQAQVPIKENWFQVLTKSLFYRYDNTNAKRPKVVFFRRPGAKSKR